MGAVSPKLGGYDWWRVYLILGFRGWGSEGTALGDFGVRCWSRWEVLTGRLASSLCYFYCIVGERIVHGSVASDDVVGMMLRSTNPSPADSWEYLYFTARYYPKDPVSTP
jgi:hypothetical protein